jgi:hypothetical protein
MITRHAAIPLPEARDNRPLWKVLGSWFSEPEWDHFVSVSFREPPSVERARREFHDRWIRRVAWLAHRPLEWVRVIAGGSAQHRGHVHAVVAGTKHLTTAQLEGRGRLATLECFSTTPIAAQHTT